MINMIVALVILALIWIPIVIFGYYKILWPCQRREIRNFWRCQLRQKP